MTKHDKEIMEILAAFDLTSCARSPGQLAGADPHTVARYVAIRDSGGNPYVRPERPKIIDPYLEKVEELVERSEGHVNLPPSTGHRARAMNEGGYVRGKWAQGAYPL